MAPACPGVKPYTWRCLGAAAGRQVLGGGAGGIRIFGGEEANGASPERPYLPGC